MAKKQRPRTAQRMRERVERKLVRDRQALAELAPGGSAERAIAVPTSSVISVRARATPCPLCAGELRIDEELAADALLREVRMTCVRCGVKRSLWFTLAGALAN